MNPVAALIEPEVAELIAAGDYASLREALHGVQPADVADILSGLEAEKAAIAFRFLPRDDAGEVFAYLAPDVQEKLITQLGDKASVRIVEAMDLDDRARLLDELPNAVAQRIVASLSPQERAETQAILGYAPRTIGRLMTPDFVQVRADWSVARALDHIRRHGRDAETINVVYVVDDQGVLVDDLRLRQVIMAEPDTPISALMNNQFVTLRADQPQEEAVQALLKYDRVALPVVDSRGALLGIVTHDDVADVAVQEATEDMQKIGGVQALEEPFMQTSMASLFKKRAPWLVLLFLSELLTSNAIAFFEDEIKRAAILAAFIPAIISSGGNSGSQASTLVIRAMGLREIELSDWLRVLWRELGVAILLGLMIGVIGLFRISLFGWLGWFKDPNAVDHYAILGVTIGVTLLGVVVWGSVMGAMLPFALKRLRLDPAGSSTPFVATLVDVTGIVIYFTVAMVTLKSTLLRPDAPDTLIHTSAIVEVVSVDGYNQGDTDIDLTVRLAEQGVPSAGAASEGLAGARAENAIAPQGDGAVRRVSIHLKDLPDGKVPAKGERLVLHFASADAERAERAGPGH